jgi:hypothetical protein
MQSHRSWFELLRGSIDVYVKKAGAIFLGGRHFFVVMKAQLLQINLSAGSPSSLVRNNHKK